MKKFIAIAFMLVVLILALCGCGPKTETVELEANATTGYHWEYEVSEEGIVKIEGEYVPYENKGGLVGVGGTQVYTVTGLKEGTTEVTFQYLAPGTGAVGLTDVYTFIVDKDLNVEKKLPE